MPAKKHLFIKLASGISAFLVLAYFGISAYAGHTLSKPNRCFDPNMNPKRYVDKVADFYNRSLK
jgi:hypothetical protein